MSLRIPIPSILLPRPARFAPLSGLASACLVSAALLAGGCSHDHGDRYDRVERVERIERYPAEPAPPPPVEETVVEEPAPYTPPPTEVTTVYEQDLNPYGHWVEVREYGRCWVPNDRPSGWRPYTVGHWVYTSEGTCWVAEEREADWGNVCYHYGRWYEDPGEGWVWVPGTTYAPNWCAWREGGGYCAWAPLPPQCGDGPVSVTVIDRYVPEDRYVVVDERYIAEPHVYEHVQRNNVTIINKTTNITNIKVVNNTIINQGVPRAHVEKRAGRTIPLVQVDRVRNEAEARALARQGKPVVYAPPVVQRYAESHPPRPARVAPARSPSLDTRQREAQLAEQRARGNGLSAQQQAARQAELERQRTQGQLRTQGPPQPQRVSPQVTAQERAAQDRASKQAQGERQRLQGYNPGTATPQRSVQERAIPNRSVPDRTAQERAAQERAAQQAEVERQREQQRNQQQIQNRNASQDQLHSAFDKAAREQQAQDRAAQDRAARERAVQERAAQERATQERAAEAKAAQERAAQERVAQERIAQERVAQERVAQERVAQERVTQDRTAQAAQARAAQERAAQERAAQERSAQAAQERAAQQRAVEERQSARQPAPPAKTDSRSGKPGQNAQDVQDPRYPQR